MPDERDTLLTGGQRRMVGFALTFGASIGALALLIGVLIVLGDLVGYFAGVLWPLATAGVFALILRPLVEVAEARLRVRRIFAVILLYGIFIWMVAGLLVLVLPPLIEQIINFVFYVPTLWSGVVEFSQTHYPQWVQLAREQMQNPTIRRVVESMSEEAKVLVTHTIPSLKAAGGSILGVFAFVTHVAVIPVYLFFFLLIPQGRGTRRLRDHLPFFSDGVRDDITFLVREFVSIVESFFRGQLIIGFIMGVLYAAGYTIIGLHFGLFLGLAAGLLNIVPYLGTIIGLAMTLPLAFLQDDGGGWPLVGLVLLVKLIVQVIESWVLTPKIMGDRTGLHPVMIIVAVFFWGTAFQGIIGMLLAIPLTAFFVTAWRLAQRKYVMAVAPDTPAAT
jgi:predicted PurR-regulated permease PerM